LFAAISELAERRQHHELIDPDVEAPGIPFQDSGLTRMMELFVVILLDGISDDYTFIAGQDDCKPPDPDLVHMCGYLKNHVTGPSH
jgi:hypothetical protein